MNNWQTVALGDVCTLLNGRAYKKNELLSEGKYPVLRVGNFFSNRKWYYSDLELEENKYCDNGDLLYAWSASFGPRIWEGEKVIYHYHIWKTKLDEKRINKRFLYYWFDWDTNQIKSDHGAGSTMIHVTKSSMEKRKLRLPPLPEQKRIVAILDKAFEGIDTAIANTEKNLANARELFESYLKSVFLENNWETKSLNEISVNLDKKRVPITKGKRVSGNIPYYGASGIVDYVKDYIFDGNYLLVSEDGANLIARTYPIAFSVSGKSWVNNHAHILEFKDSASQKFIEFYLNSIPLEPYISGMAQPKLNQKKLNEIPIPYPDKATRENIVKKAGVLKDQSRSLENVYQQKLTALSELKQSLLNKAFSGELTTIKDDELRTEAVA